VAAEQCRDQDQIHAIDWDSVKARDQESDKTDKLTREAVWIYKSNNTNRDKGSYQLSHVWDKLLLTDVSNRKSVLMKS